MVVNILQISGAVLVTTGAALAWPPAGFIVAGAFAIIFGLRLERR